MKSSLSDIAHLIDGTVVGDSKLHINGLSSIDNISPGSLVYAENEDYLRLAEASEAAAIIVNQAVNTSNKALIRVKNPTQAFIRLLNHLHPAETITPGIHPSAVLSENVQIGKNVYIGPFVYIGEGSVIGDHCVLKSHIHVGKQVSIGNHSTIHPQVTLYDHCQIGSEVTIHASSVIGADGFGYTFVDGKHLKMPHIGRVVIEDQVEIGANTAIDRASMGDTIIGEGTKIDNLVQVAHSVKLGKHNILCGFTGVAGSTVSGDNVIFAANVGVSDHVRIDNNVVLGARAGVPPKKHLKEGLVYLGNPARPIEIAIKQELSVNRIPLMRKNIKALTEELQKLKKQLAAEETD